MPREGTKTVFHAYLLKNAQYDSLYEIPILKPEYEIPTHLIPFSKSLKSKDYDAYVHFFEHDIKIERVWNKPPKYLDNLRRSKTGAHIVKIIMEVFEMLYLNNNEEKVIGKFASVASNYYNKILILKWRFVVK